MPPDKFRGFDLSTCFNLFILQYVIFLSHNWHIWHLCCLVLILAPSNQMHLNAVLCYHAPEKEPPSRSGLFCGQKISNGKYECLGCETKLLLENKTMLKLNIIMQSHLTLTSQNDPTHQSNLLIDQTRGCPCNLSGCRPLAPRNQSHTTIHRIGDATLKSTMKYSWAIAGNDQIWKAYETRTYSPPERPPYFHLPTRNLSDEMVP